MTGRQVYDYEFSMRFLGNGISQEVYTIRAGVNAAPICECHSIDSARKVKNALNMFGKYKATKPAKKATNGKS